MSMASCNWRGMVSVQFRLLILNLLPVAVPQHAAGLSFRVAVSLCSSTLALPRGQNQPRRFQPVDPFRVALVHTSGELFWLWVGRNVGRGFRTHFGWTGCLFRLSFIRERTARR